MKIRNHTPVSMFDMAVAVTCWWNRLNYLSEWGRTPYRPDEILLTSPGWFNNVTRMFLVVSEWWLQLESWCYGGQQGYGAQSPCHDIGVPLWCHDEHCPGRRWSSHNYSGGSIKRMENKKIWQIRASCYIYLKPNQYHWKLVKWSFTHNGLYKRVSFIKIQKYTFSICWHTMTSCLILAFGESCQNGRKWQGWPGLRLEQKF